VCSLLARIVLAKNDPKIQGVFMYNGGYHGGFVVFNHRVVTHALRKDAESIDHARWSSK
jgi:hypothetical protein